MIIIDKYGKIIDVHRLLAKEMGYTLAELIGCHCLEFVHNDDHKLIPKTLHDKQRIRCLKSNGEYVMLVWNAMYYNGNYYGNCGQDLSTFIHDVRDSLNGIIIYQCFPLEDLTENDARCIFNSAGRLLELINNWTTNQGGN